MVSYKSLVQSAESLAHKVIDYSYDHWRDIHRWVGRSIVIGAVALTTYGYVAHKPVAKDVALPLAVVGLAPEFYLRLMKKDKRDDITPSPLEKSVS